MFRMLKTTQNSDITFSHHLMYPIVLVPKFGYSLLRSLKYFLKLFFIKSGLKSSLLNPFSAAVIRYCFSGGFLKNNKVFVQSKVINLMFFKFLANIFRELTMLLWKNFVLAHPSTQKSDSTLTFTYVYLDLL